MSIGMGMIRADTTWIRLVVVADPSLHHEVVSVLINTAKAHHDATGGPNPGWAEWYAEHAVDELNQVLGSEMTVIELAEWLAQADIRYREEKPEESWPKAYASWLLA
ncbi:MAG TPA: hypothetical protein VLA91_00575 [Acidimicrobiia bacterium]|nr:hypothetical protein [Acidimicrobiia bacterium]